MALMLLLFFLACGLRVQSIGFTVVSHIPLTKAISLSYHFCKARILGAGLPRSSEVSSFFWGAIKRHHGESNGKDSIK